MAKQVTVLLRQPDQIRRGLEAARQMRRHGHRPQVIFLCPGCNSRRVCRTAAPDPGGEAPACFTDRCEDCAPDGFHCADAERIAGMIRGSDLVLPL